MLRHNLRNDLNVVQGYINEVHDALNDDKQRGYLDKAARKTSDVIALGEKARRIEEALSTDQEGSVQVQALLTEIAADLEGAYPTGNVTLDIPTELELHGSAKLIEAVFYNLMENGLEHDPPTILMFK